MFLLNPLQIVLLCILTVHGFLEFKITRDIQFSKPLNLTVTDSKISCTGNGSVLLLARTKDRISLFNGDSTDSVFTLQWEKVIPDTEIEESRFDLVQTENYGSILIVWVTSGLRFYKIEDNNSYQIKPLYEDGRFHSLYGWKSPNSTLKWGWIFPSKRHLALLSKDTSGKVKFYSVSLKSLVNREANPVLELDPNITKITEERWWTFPETYLDIVGSFIIARSSQEFSIYQFNKAYQLGKVNSQDELAGTGLQIFPNGNMHDGILLLNTSGFHNFNYNSSQQKYELSWTDTLHFSKWNGWNLNNYRSITQFTYGNGTTGLIYYGPAGLGIALIRNEGVQLVKHQDNIGSKPYSYPKAVAKCHGQIFAMLEDTDYKAFPAKLIIKEVKEVPMHQHETNFSRIRPKTKPLFYLEESKRPTQLRINDWFTIWKNPLDYNEVIIDPKSGHAQFILPLIHFHETILMANYHSSRSASGVLGVGWTLPIMKDYIFKDAAGSNFEDLHSYFLSLDGALVQLHPNRTGGVGVFYIPGQPYVNIKQSIQNGSWVVTLEDTGSTLTFGGEPNSTQRSLKWTFGYRGKVTDLNSLEEDDVAWYLTKRETNRGSIQYTYDSKEANVLSNTKSYTDTIFLQKIEDVGHNAVMKFGYEEKPETECMRENSFNSDGSVSFPVPLANCIFLSWVSAETTKLHQKLKFDYIVVSGSRRLTSVQQLSGPIALFEYDPESEMLLSKVFVPAIGVNVSIGWSKRLPESSATHTFPKHEMGNIDLGPDYHVIHYVKRYPRITVRLDIYSLLSSPVCRPETEAFDSNIKSYSVIPYASFIYVITNLKNGTSLETFRRIQNSTACGGWVRVLSGTKSYPKQTLFRATATRLAVIAPGAFEVSLFPSLADDDETQIVSLSKVLSQNIVAAATSTFIALYDNNVLTLLHPGPSGRWRSLSFEGYAGWISSTENFFHKFNTTTEIRNAILKAITPATLKASDNTILLSAFELGSDGRSSAIKLNLLRVATNYTTITTICTHTLIMEDLLSLSQNIEGKDGTNCTVMYKMENSHFNLKVIDVKGKAREGVDAIRNKNRRQDAFEDLLKEINMAEGWTKFLRNMSLLTWDMYTTSFSADGVCVSNKLIDFRDGKVRSVPTSSKVRLGSHLNLLQEEETGSKFQITGEGVSYKFNVTPAWNVKIAFPYFFAYQNESSVIVVPFSKDLKRLGNAVTYNGETIHSLTSARMGLVTMRWSKGGKYASGQELVIRPSLGFHEGESIQCTSIITSAKGVQRKTFYEHKQDGVKIIPGGDAGLSGYKDVIFHKNGSVTQHFYNSKSALVKTLYPKPKPVPATSGTEKSESLDHFTLKDRYGEMLILHTIPYRLSDDMVDFHSFEEYEEKGKWIYNTSNVVRGLTSFSGQSYLQIAPNSGLQRTFLPSYQAGVYIASCWVRIRAKGISSIAYDGSDAPFLKVVYLIPNNGSELIGVFGKIKRIHGRWLYAEVIVDLPYAAEQFYIPALDLSPTNFSLSMAFKLQIEGGKYELELDNVMFRSASFDIEASVYDEENRIADRIGSSGSSKKFHYNQLLQKVGESDETGRVTQISIQNPLKNYSILVESKSGWYENWEGFEQWDLTGYGDISVFLGGLAHNGGTSKLNLREPPSSFLIRFEYNIGDGELEIDIGLALISIGRTGTIALNGVIKTLFAPNHPEGELVLLLMEGKRLCALVNGGIIFEDFQPSQVFSKLTLTIKGTLSLSSIFLMPYPLVKVTYTNALKEPIQKVTLESSSSAVVSQTLYDGIGRPFLKTRSTRGNSTSNDGSLMKFHSNFVRNFNKNTKQIEGDVSDLNPFDENFSYYSEEYEDYPGGPVLSRGLPGKCCVLGGPFGTRTKVNKSVPFIRNLFPPAVGYTYKTRAYANGKQTFWVYKDALLRAIYILAPMFDHRLTTYDYEGRNLVRILPPSYHKAVDTFSRLTRWDSSPVYEEIAKLHGTFFAYEGAQLKRKTNREEGTIHFLFDDYGRQRFRVYQPFGTDNFTRVIYTFFDQLTGLLLTSGLFTKPISHLAELKQYLVDDSALPQSYLHEFQRSAYSDNSNSVGNVKQIYTNNGGYPVIEEITSNNIGEITKKSVIFLPAVLTQAWNINISKSRNPKGVERLCYPVLGELNSDPFCLLRKYNKFGQLVSIAQGSEISFQFKYDADGRILREEHKDVVQEYSYNSPGYLKSIKDPFLTLSLSYEEKGTHSLPKEAGY